MKTLETNFVNPVMVASISTRTDGMYLSIALTFMEIDCLWLNVEVT